MIPAGPLVRLERIVHAPRHHVYVAWRKPERMARWWSATHVGGSSVRCIDGAHRTGRAVVHVLDELPFERLGFLWGDGDAVETRVTITFHDHPDGTRLAIVQELAPRRDLGLRGSLDRLAVLLRTGALG